MSNLGPNSFAGYQHGGYIPTSSPPNSPRKNEGNITRTLIPVTIKQLIEAEQSGPEDIFIINGQQYNGKVTIVGLVVSQESNERGTDYILNDGTGSIDVQRPNINDPSRIETYVRVVGDLHVLNERKSILCNGVVPIEDFNEITYHFLEAIYINSKSPQLNDQSGGFSTLEQQILHILKTTPATLEGLSIDHIIMELHSRFGQTPVDIRPSLDSLVDQGYIFPSKDSDHFSASSI